jgi:uncharacterized protein (DUF885 family)
VVEKERSQNAGVLDGDISAISDHIMSQLAHQFPVCMASDEFHFFPQARINQPDWSVWDDFSAESMADLESRHSRWQHILTQFCRSDSDSKTKVDAELLQRVLQTLIEQLTLVTPQQKQPSFYLTIMGIGLAEAVDKGPNAWISRLKGLPNFIDQARHTLKDVPQLFARLALKMLPDQVSWLEFLAPPQDLLKPILFAFSEFETFLRELPFSAAVLPEVDLYEQVAAVHMGCDMKPVAIAEAIEIELNETQEILTKEAERREPGQAWQTVIDNLPPPQIPPGGMAEVYRQTIDQLAQHSVAQGFLSTEESIAWPVQVEMIPDYMRPVRSNAAFSALPGHPPQGGIFYIQNIKDAKAPPADYRLLTAHETYPGHHLLDSHRWNQKRVARRHIEFPIFYEGWASFSEELLFDTGFFGSQIDRMLLAKRRFWRALRGRVDLEVHTRQRQPEEAAAILIEFGLPSKQAKDMVNRYILKPGYQLAYTIGRRRFRHLYDQYRGKGQEPQTFAQKVLAQGEIGFDTLAHVLSEGG